MSLTREEKKTLNKFLGLYLGSSFLLFAIIAYLFYQNEARFFLDKTRSSMQIEANSISSEIIHAHMTQTPLALKDILNKYRDNIGFYNPQNHPLVSEISEPIKFDQHIYQEGERMVLVDPSAFGHLGVDKIVIQRGGIGSFMMQLKFKIISILLMSYLMLGIVGYFLAKLFIKPLQLKRIQLDNFIKDSTHELNTPVTALMLSVNTPQVSSPKNLERIRLSATRIADIHKDLSYLMLDSTPSSEMIQRRNLNEIIQQELGYLSLLAEKKKITITTYYHEEIYFKIDKESFIRLIHNLITNAIKYNHMGGTIEIVLKNSTIRITDSGIGIPKEHQREIYQRFYRATHQVGGFGLGLNIVHTVCQRYGIEIEFESKVDEGTTFWLRF
jgi:two-component system OmpR family sensor kinase